MTFLEGSNQKHYRLLGHRVERWWVASLSCPFPLLQSKGRICPLIHFDLTPNPVAPLAPAQRLRAICSQGLPGAPAAGRACVYTNHSYHVLQLKARAAGAGRQTRGQSRESLLRLGRFFAWQLWFSVIPIKHEQPLQNTSILPLWKVKQGVTFCSANPSSLILSWESMVALKRCFWH